MKSVAVSVLVTSAIVSLGAWWMLRTPDEPVPVASAGSPSTFAQMPVGKVAPDFELPQVPGGIRSKLSASRGRATVLMFGSFSCDLFCSQLPELGRMYQEHGEVVNFVFVYIREAGHDNSALDKYMRTLPESTDRLTAGLDLYSIRFTCLDGRDSEAVREYQAWPERLYLIDADGVVVWDSLPGYGQNGLRLAEAEEKLRELVKLTEPGR